MSIEERPSEVIMEVKNEEKMTGPIKLPQTLDIAFRNIKDAKIFAMDIGGSLTKIAYYSTVPNKKIFYENTVPLPETNPNIEVQDDTIYEVCESARLHFIKFETKHIETTIDHIRQSIIGANTAMHGTSIKVTGGGAFKYADLIERKLGLKINKEDEMQCLIRGVNFLLRNITDESYIYEKKDSPAYHFQKTIPQEMYPYLLVTIGSGTSILKVDSEDKLERIGGTAIGGGTFVGLGNLLTGATGFDELFALAEKGDHRKVDMLVKDIYGSGYSAVGLPADLIAASFGKTGPMEPGQERPFSEADIARSLLYTISNDIGQIACLYAMLHKVKKVYFGGFFLRHHPVSLHTLSYAINYWSKGQVQAHFLRHEGYLGAIGAFLKGAQSYDTENYSWTENLYGSSSFKASKIRGNREGSVEVDHLEIDRFDSQLVYCPLILDPKHYIADTVDLTRDNEARQYWIQCFRDSLPKFTDRAIASQLHAPEVEQRALRFQEKFLHKLEMFCSQPCAFGNLTVRGLLDLREHCLQEFDFHDPYLRQKQMENNTALALLHDHLQRLQNLDWKLRQEKLVVGFLAGNIFDWGAKEVALLMEAGEMDFESAISHLGPRPWHIDHVDLWVQTVQRRVYRCAVIFIDNSGADFILGVIPFVEELLRLGTKVILCANTRPVLNDVTYAELTLLLTQVATISSVIDSALKTGQLVARDSGQGSPCLDLAKINYDLASEMEEKQVDLLILEGMGRAIHTNLYTKFSCDCLKVAVLKNRWLAKRLGGEMYAVIFKFETIEPENSSR